MKIMLQRKKLKLRKKKFAARFAKPCFRKAAPNVLIAEISYKKRRVSPAFFFYKTSFLL